MGRRWRGDLDVQDFDATTETIAQSQFALGVEQGDRVALQLPNSAELAWCYYGCVKIIAIAVSIAAYKAPERIEIVDEFPKGATGKVRRRTLVERARRTIASESATVSRSG